MDEKLRIIKDLVDFCVSGERYNTQNPYTIDVIRAGVDYLYKETNDEEYKLFSREVS